MNKLLISLVVVMACAALGLAEFCTPDQWEGYEGVFGGYVNHRRPGVIQESVRVSYDATNQRSASFINMVTEDYERKFHVVVRYTSQTSGKMYIVDLKNNTCWTKNLSKPYRRACIPADAKSYGEYYLGLQGKGLLVSGYNMNIHGMTVSISVSKLGDNFIPIGETIWGKVRQTSFIETVGFTGVTPGIKNATVFDVPPQCQHKQEFSPAQFLTREHFVLAL